MWKIIWASYLAWYVYTVFTQDYTMDKSNSLQLAYYGGFWAFLVCVHYGMSFKEWFGQIKEDKVPIFHIVKFFFHSQMDARCEKKKLPTKNLV